MTPDEPDQSLYLRAQRGDETAFAALYRRHRDAVYRFALMLCGVPAIAADATQEAFLLIVHEPQRYDPARGVLAAFLMGIARNHVRRARSEPLAPLPRDDDEASDEGLGHEHTPLVALLQGESLAALRAALLDLPFAYREALVLCDLQEMPYQHAADVIGCPVGTVRSRLSRARARLTQLLAGTHAAPGLELAS